MLYLYTCTYTCTIWYRYYTCTYRPKGGDAARAGEQAHMLAKIVLRIVLRSALQTSVELEP